MSRASLTRPAPLPELPAAYAYLGEPPDPPRARVKRRHRRLLLAATYLMLAGLVLFVGRHVRAAEVVERRAAPEAPGTQHSAPPTPRAPAPLAAAGTSGKFSVAPGYGAVLGSTGPIRRFRVAVEEPTAADLATEKTATEKTATEKTATVNATEKAATEKAATEKTAGKPTDRKAAGAKTADGTPVDRRLIAGFAAEIDRTLGDRRSWIAARRFRLQRVPISAHADFTIFLASARTSERMCRTGGLETGAYTSCRLPERVIINDDRWRGSVRGYGAPVSSYRQYVINHEVGHQLGHGHEACPGKGRPAPVMMQQTYGLKGCTANSWPYPKGRRYAGPPAP
jgi:hypothetical protein